MNRKKILPYLGVIIMLLGASCVESEVQTKKVLLVEALYIDNEPLANMGLIPITASFKITFSEPLDTTYIYTKIELRRKGFFGDPAEIDVRSSEDLKSLEILLKENTVLAFNSYYTLSIHQNLFSKDGRSALNSEVVVDLRTVSTSEKGITSFVFKRDDNLFLNQDIVCIIIGQDITAVMDPTMLKSEISQLKPSITFSGTRTLPESGLSQNFNRPVEYTVIAADESVLTYTVSVSFSSISKEAELVSIYLPINGANKQGHLSGNQILFDSVQYGANLSTITPVAIISPGALSDPPLNAPQNFSYPISYAITAQDRKTVRRYDVVISYGDVTLQTANIDSTVIYDTDYERETMFKVKGLADTKESETWNFKMEIGSFSSRGHFDVVDNVGLVPNSFTKSVWELIALTFGKNNPLPIELTVDITNTVPEKTFTISNISIQSN